MALFDHPKHTAPVHTADNRWHWQKHGMKRWVRNRPYTHDSMVDPMPISAHTPGLENDTKIMLKKKKKYELPDKDLVEYQCKEDKWRALK